MEVDEKMGFFDLLSCLFESYVQKVKRCGAGQDAEEMKKDKS